MMTLVLVAELWFSLSLTTVLALGLKFMLCYCLHRDALAKEIYTQLFGWLISKVNNIIFKGKMQMSIAVLDIFGFEVSYVLRCKTCFDCWEAPLRDPLVGSIFCPVAFMTKMP